MTNKPLFIKNEDELYMMLSVFLSFGEILPIPNKTALMRLICEDYRRLVDSKTIKPFQMPKAESDDIQEYNKLIINLKHMMLDADFPMHEDEKGNLKIDHETLIKRYLNKDLPFQQESED